MARLLLSISQIHSPRRMAGFLGEKQVKTCFFHLWLYFSTAKNANG
jgi:hypothetical protein|tara:strand:+ start:595 stop:732 length:138 start_codon:yes stop_codon:yes gene_type:complete